MCFSSFMDYFLQKAGSIGMEMGWNHSAKSNALGDGKAD